ncbi:tumor necrosis factor receptor superfamily member 1A-like [Pteronotus mesoamericanus]|uniref:tumor necrosis factor receptor superfamily member 1A-like n=1 Tax=Pteronotus mesoamericanus TaxID=1884717 RepID=UPI0023EC662B|nr:tumor necrosis factor receptor superfamily member 1A-like [Pteronotus parnellii mesoamericanus]
MLWRPRLLLILAAVTIATSGPPCDTGKYEFRGLCCDLCLPGFYVSRDCVCSPCEPGFFTAHHNRETSCLACTECHEDQEVVAECTRDSNRRCQCKTGSFYCDSPNCVEKCHRCTRCDGPTLQPCNATRDTVCAAQGNPRPGDPPSYHANGSDKGTAVVVFVSVVIVVIIITVIVIYCTKRGVPLPHLVVRWLKHESGDSGNPESTEPRISLLSTHAEHGRPTPGVDTAPLLEHWGSAEAPGAETCPGPSEDPEGGIQRQVVVDGGSGAAPEPILQTQAPAAPGRPGQAGVVAPISVLEQEYQQNYVLKDRSPEAIYTIYCVFGQEVPQSHWRMFMRFVGLEENDIDICEQENWGNVAEQHYQMLRRWQSKQGRAASPFRLLAALRKLQLHECLENVINKLVDGGILGSKHAEPPN